MGLLPNIVEQTIQTIHIQSFMVLGEIQLKERRYIKFIEEQRSEITSLRS